MIKASIVTIALNFAETGNSSGDGIRVREKNVRKMLNGAQRIPAIVSPIPGTEIISSPRWGYHSDIRSTFEAASPKE